MNRQSLASSRTRRTAPPKGRRPVTVRRFAPEVIAKLTDGQYLRIRAGMGDHKFIGIWVVVVEGRAFVRSWSIKPRSWYRTFLEEPRGAIVVDGQEIEVRARRVTSERLNGLIDQAYLDKYNTKGSLKYARDLGMPKSRATTTELTPA